jgi:acyl-coenzyme A thioesterase PaaI-like protein
MNAHVPASIENARERELRDRLMRAAREMHLAVIAGGTVTGTAMLALADGLAAIAGALPEDGQPGARARKDES